MFSSNLVGIVAVAILSIPALWQTKSSPEMSKVLALLALIANLSLSDACVGNILIGCDVKTPSDVQLAIDTFHSNCNDAAWNERVEGKLVQRSFGLEEHMELSLDIIFENCAP